MLSNLTWREGSIPQVAQPFTRDGRDYLLEVDEFSKYGIQGDGSVDASKAVVGAARIIDVTNLRRPVVVSNLRLGVQQPGPASPRAATPARARRWAATRRTTARCPTARSPGSSRAR